MNSFWILCIVILILLFYTNTHNSTKTYKEVWIGGPTSHVPKPMARWEYS